MRFPNYENVFVCELKWPIIRLHWCATHHRANVIPCPKDSYALYVRALAILFGSRRVGFLSLRTMWFRWKALRSFKPRMTFNNGLRRCHLPKLQKFDFPVGFITKEIENFSSAIIPSTKNGRIKTTFLLKLGSTRVQYLWKCPLCQQHWWSSYWLPMRQKEVLNFWKISRL